MHTANRSSTGSRSTYHSTSATGCAPAAHARAKGARPMDAADDFLSEAYARSAGHCADAASALSFRCAPCFSGSLKRRCSCAAAACSSTAFCGCAAARATRLYTVSAVDMSTKQRTPKLRSSSTWIRSKSSCSSAARCSSAASLVCPKSAAASRSFAVRRSMAAARYASRTATWPASTSACAVGCVVVFTPGACDPTATNKLCRCTAPPRSRRACCR
mmetsp:Transcript_24810/g.83391  ORF Transcript_24810/g.83391 Transcript_24810/m.83391 type:complete len:217 (+) Transcript_24810:273-923(+)